ncbi:MAG: protein-disulfide reductase DsbD domain-containing protein [Verrucomicrobiota bacterium]|nr:protein-disulfide reductase DsbD domain-containing protein [Verrucomicrobiota bacterium]
MFRNKLIFPALARKRLEESLVLWVNLLLFGIILSGASVIATPLHPLPSQPYYEATQTPPKDCEHARVQLIADTSIVVPGKSFLLGIRFELEKNWHLYWENPGSSGFPLSIEWNLPTDFEVGPLQFPSPRRYELSGLVTYVHENTPMFIVEVTVPKNAPVNTTINIQANADWLLCKEECIADSANLRLEIPIGESEIQINSGWFAQALAEQPESSKELALKMIPREKQLDLVLDLDGLPVEHTKDVYFYPRMEGIINPNAAQVLVKKPAGGSGLQRLELSYAQHYLDNFSDGLTNLTGVLEVGPYYYAATATAPVSITKAVSQEISFEQRLIKYGLFGWLLLAFLGGMILNFMPCVLPVLSLKVFSLLKHSGQSRSNAVAQGLSYTLGVVLSFVVLAGILFLLRSAGESIGWGYQLQNPGFTLSLGILFFVFGLNLMGVFEVGGGLVGIDSKWAQRRDVQGSFVMGVLAAVVGAPCMGPLVASVSGIAIQIPAPQGLLIFGTMGLGLAFPFFLLTAFPSLHRLLPKPGAWMETLKRAMGILLMLAVIFIAWVMGQSGGISAVVALCFSLCLAGVAVWIFGRWGSSVRALKTRRLATAVSLLLLVVALAFGALASRRAYAQSIAVIQSEGPWATWSPDRVEEELVNGNPVFVDFTASWCLICQANKIALRSESADTLFDTYGFITLEADWTKRDPIITTVLQEYGRAGVPLYLIYLPNGQVIELPQTITNTMLQDIIMDYF